MGKCYNNASKNGNNASGVTIVKLAQWPDKAFANSSPFNTMKPTRTTTLARTPHHPFSNQAQAITPCSGVLTQDCYPTVGFPTKKPQILISSPTPAGNASLCSLSLVAALSALFLSLSKADGEPRGSRRRTAPPHPAAGIEAAASTGHGARSGCASPPLSLCPSPTSPPPPVAPLPSPWCPDLVGRAVAVVGGSGRGSGARSAPHRDGRGAGGDRGGRRLFHLAGVGSALSPSLPRRRSSPSTSSAWPPAPPPPRALAKGVTGNTGVGNSVHKLRCAQRGSSLRFSVKSHRGARPPGENTRLSRGTRHGRAK